MAWRDGREDLDRLVTHNKNCHPDEVIYVWKEWSSSDGITWGNVDDEGNSITYNPDGEDIVGENIFDEIDLEAINTWYAKHFEELVEKYGGKAIAVVDEEIISVEDTEKKANEVARNKYPHKVPFVAYVPKVEEVECLLL